MSTLTLSGWAQPSDALTRGLSLHHAHTFDYSEYPNAQASFDALARHGDVQEVIAWSMGAQLAIRAVAAGVLRPTHMTLLCAPFQFVSDQQFSGGMDPITYQQFRTNYAEDPARTKKKFHALVAKGDSYARRIQGMLDHHPQVDDTARWLPWLDDLAETSLRGVDASALPPTLLIYGTEDAIVPIAQAEKMHQLLPQATVSRWVGAAHAPHLHDAARVLHEIASHKHGGLQVA
jgi:pimeloyl-[acyl-carrier protein] methyl ester esterase